MHNSTVLILALTMLWSISVTARGETSASTATLKMSNAVRMLAQQSAMPRVRNA